MIEIQDERERKREEGGEGEWDGARHTAPRHWTSNTFNCRKAAIHHVLFLRPAQLHTLA